MHKSRILTSYTCLLVLFAKIKFPGKFPNLQYVPITGAADDNFCAITLEFLGE